MADCIHLGGFVPTDNGPEHLCAQYGRCSFDQRDWLQLCSVACDEYQYARAAAKPVELKWIEPKPIEFTRNHDCLVVTVAIGKEFEKLLAITGPLMQSYADRVNADFIAITDKTQVWPLFEKFRIKQLVEAYDRTLFIDADCIVRSTARDLFEETPVGSIGVHDDYTYNHSWDWAIKEWNLLQQSQGLDEPFLKRLLNSGVVVCDREHAEIWTPPPKPIPGNHCDEQFWIDRAIDRLGFKIHPLPLACNHQWWMTRVFSQQLDQAEIVHLAGCSRNRLAVTKQLAI